MFVKFCVYFKIYASYNEFVCLLGFFFVVVVLMGYNWLQLWPDD